MDNPWANGWNEDHPKPETEPEPEPVKSTWVPSHNAHSSSLGDISQEADISVPSWSTPTEIKWAEPSETGGSIWSSEQADATLDNDPGHLDAWGSTSYKGITLSRTPSPQVEDEENSEEEDVAAPSVSTSERREPTPPISSPIHEITITPPAQPQADESIPETTLHVPPAILPPSPDAFGTFEVGIPSAAGEDEDPWSNSAPSFPPDAGQVDTGEVDHWGSAWHEPKTTGDGDSDGKEKLPDEWEIARQQKERMDRQVPPELLASILQQCEEVSRDLWPLDAEDDQSLPKDDYRRDIRSGMEGVEGLTALAARFAPEEPQLPFIPPFRQTHTSKSLSEALKLSRNMPLTRSSPMSQLMASKGSLAWEASVKARPDEMSGVEIPVGWRVVGADEEKRSDKDIGKKSTGGGLLSFWGRKSSSNATMDTAKRDSSASPSATPRTSVDLTAKAIAASPASTPPLITSLIPSQPTSSNSTPTSISGPTISPASPRPPDVFDPAPAPSAVSRFLGRFSRTRSATSNPSQRHSLALSPDDLEFLSDFVPSANDPDEDSLGFGGTDALSSMIKSSPLPTKLPPPLAPPPKAPAMSRPVSNIGTVKPDLDSLFSLSSVGSAPPPTKSSFPTPMPPPLAPSPAISALSSGSKPASPRTTSFPSTSAAVTPVDRPLSSFVLPPPPLSRSQSPAPVASPPHNTNRSSFIKSTSPPPLLPPPKAPSRTHTPKPSIIAPPTTSLLSNAFDNDDDDDFSDFHSPPSRANPFSLHSAVSGYSNSSPESANNPLFGRQKSTPTSSKNMPSASSFDDFDDFISSSPMRSPSPPIPPAKPPPRQNAITPPPKTSPHHQRKPSIPQAFSPPPGGMPQSKPLNFDFLGGISSASKTNRSAGAPAPTSSPAWMSPARPTSSSANENGQNGLSGFSPPPPSQPTFSGSPNLSQTLVSFPSNLAKPSPNAFNKKHSPVPTAPATKSSGGPGGLSAQDLSFFEGL